MLRALFRAYEALHNLPYLDVDASLQKPWFPSSINKHLLTLESIRLQSRLPHSDNSRENRKSVCIETFTMQCTAL